MILLGMILFIWTKTFTVDKTFLVSATVPAATSVSISAFSVSGTPPVFTAVTGTSLSFNPLTFEPTNKIYLPNHFFAIDVAPVGGAGNPNVSFTYTEGSNPNSPGHGLGFKWTATFVKVTGPTNSPVETGIAAHGPKKLLKDLAGETINKTEITGGFLRIYLGVVTLDPNATFKDPTGAEVFSNADAPGPYDGSLLISATLP